MITLTVLTSTNNIIMKIKRILIITIFFVIFFNLNKSKNTGQEKVIQNEDMTTEILENSADEFEINKYRVILKDVTNYKVEIFPNFNTNNTSQNILEKFGCDILVNGGLYEKDGNPLGLYYLNGKYYSKIKASNLYNGILALDDNNNWDILKTKDLQINEDKKYYMQSGPLFIINGILSDISSISSGARRIIFAKDDNYKDYIIIMTVIDNFNLGPELTEIPEILTILNDKHDKSIINAINLDGGNSSLYIDGNYYLKESVFAGSFICFSEN